MRKPSTKIPHAQSENAVVKSAGKVHRAVAKERWNWTLTETLSFHAVAFTDSHGALDSHCRPSGRARARAKALLAPCSSPELSAGAAALSWQQGPGSAPSSPCGALASLGSSPTPAARERRAWPGTPTQPDRAVHSQEDVGALQIPVHHPVGMEEIQALQTLRENKKHEGKNQWLEYFTPERTVQNSASSSFAVTDQECSAHKLQANGARQS